MKTFLPELCISKRIIVIFFIISSIGVSFAQKPEAREGVINLQEYTMPLQGPLSLKGQWEFYWEEFVMPGEFSNKVYSEKEYISVPGYWNRKGPHKRQKYGYGTYRLRVLACKESVSTYDNSTPFYGLKINAIESACRVYINGEMVYASGKPASEREMEVARKKPFLVPVKESGEELEIIIHVSNHMFDFGGITKAPVLGIYESLYQKANNRKIIFFTIFGIIIIISFYHLMIFFMHSSESPSLYFSILSLIIAVRIIFTGEAYIYDIFPSVPWAFAKFCDMSSFYLLVIFFVLFVNSLYNTFNKLFLKVIIFSGAFCAILSLLVFLPTPVILIEKAYVYSVITFLAAIYGTILIVKAVINREPGSLILLAGLSIGVLFALHDILYQILHVIDTGHMLHYGLFALVLSQSILLTKRYTLSFIEIENLSHELKELNMSLEEKVTERTHELNAALFEVETINENLTEKIRKLKRPISKQRT